MPVTLRQLVEVRSSLARDLMTYFEALMALPDLEPPSYLGDRRLTDLYIPPDVFKREKRKKRERVPDPSEENGGPGDESRRPRPLIPAEAQDIGEEAGGDGMYG